MLFGAHALSAIFVLISAAKNKISVSTMDILFFETDISIVGTDILLHGIDISFVESKISVPTMDISSFFTNTSVSVDLISVQQTFIRSKIILLRFSRDFFLF